MGLMHNDLKLLNDLFKGSPVAQLTTPEILVFIALAFIGLASILYMEILNGNENND